MPRFAEETHFVIEKEFKTVQKPEIQQVPVTKKDADGNAQTVLEKKEVMVDVQEMVSSQDEAFTRAYTEAEKRGFISVSLAHETEKDWTFFFYNQKPVDQSTEKKKGKK